MQVVLNKPQTQFIRMPQKFRAYVSGFRGGKTWVGCVARIEHFLKHPGINQGYFAPTYPQIRDIFYPTIEEVCLAMGVRCEIREANKEVHIYNGAAYIGTIICRSMEKPSTIVGFKIGDALVDEIDTMPTDKAQAAWNKIIARMSYKGAGIRNGVDVTTTPEGFKFVYAQFKGNDSANYGLIQASTYENEKNLPPDYIQSLLDTYPPELIDAYLNGQFVNLTSGTVYRNFDRVTCSSSETIKPKERLYIGQDFNVGNMASVVYVKRDDVWHAVAELTGGIDTPATCETIKQKWPEHEIVIYPDASGANRSSKGASVSDISLLRLSKFIVRAKKINPRVRDRVLSMNTAFSKGRLKVNTALCPEYTKCLEQQAYDKNGEPDKTTGHDHLVDGGGYMCAYEMPINRPAIKPLAIAGMY